MIGAAWRDAKVRAVFYQAALVVAIALVGWSLVGTLTENLAARRITTGFGFLEARAGFDISFKLFAFAQTDRILDALAVGLANTLLVTSLVGLLATVLGFALGLLSVPDNPLVRAIVRIYVELNRNNPLLVQLFFWYGLITLTFPTIRQATPFGPGVLVTNRGLFLPSIDLGGAGGLALLALIGGLLFWRVGAGIARRRRETTGRPVPWRMALPLAALAAPIATLYGGGGSFAIEYPTLQGFNVRGGLSLGPELAALVLGLTLYTSAFIAEIVRGGIATVGAGQWDAARALGLRMGPGMRLVILPQAMRVIIPPLTSQFINIAKNSTLAAAIGFPDFVLVVNTVISQTNQAIEGVLLIIGVFLVINLTVSGALNWFNARVALKER